MTRKLVLATNNRHKAVEIRAILGNVSFEIMSASDFPSFPDPEETGTTLEENARIKALAALRATGFWALADDSGLEVDALHGAPGVLSARFAGPECTFADNNRRLLEMMRDVADPLRTARFRCAAALARGRDNVRIFEGEVRGLITLEPKGASGFGYDPVFYVPELGCTFAQASAEDKDRWSHRGLAFRKVRDYLSTL